MAGNGDGRTGAAAWPLTLGDRLNRRVKISCKINFLGPGRLPYTACPRLPAAAQAPVTVPGTASSRGRRCPESLWVGGSGRREPWSPSPPSDLPLQLLSVTLARLDSVSLSFPSTKGLRPSCPAGPQGRAGTWWGVECWLHRCLPPCAQLCSCRFGRPSQNGHRKKPAEAPGPGATPVPACPASP